MVEEHVFDLLPAYALGCLDEDELIQVARHLPACAACRAELDIYWAATDQLALAAQPVVPSPQLKKRLMARVERSASRSPSSETWWQRLTASLRGSPRAWGAALGLLLIVALSISNLLLWRQVTNMQPTMGEGNMRIVRLAGTPDAPDALGYLMIFNQKDYGTLVVEDAPTLDPGYQYQLWLIRDGKRTSGGVFSVGGDGYGSLEIWADQPLDTYPSFGITIEPEGGSPGPTGEKILGGDL